MNARTRRMAGLVAVTVYLIAYIVLVVEIAARAPIASWWASLIFYIVAGLAWVIPLRPLMLWMTRPDPDGE